MATPERPGPGLESEDELLHGTEPLLSRLFRLGSSHRRRVAALAAGSALLITLLAATLTAQSPDTPDSHFTVDVAAAAYDLPHSGGVDSTLTLTNPTAEPLTLTAVTLGRAGGRDVGLGSAVLHLGLAPGEHQSVVIHGDFDCQPHHPALPDHALFTGADRAGHTRTVEAALPDSAAFATTHAAYRDQVCKIPYPLALADVSYAHLATTTDPHAFATTLDITLDTAADATPITVTDMASNTPGVHTHAQPELPLTLSPGTTTRVTLSWTVIDCAAIPPYYGIPTITTTATDPRATETRHYALGTRFDDELATALAAACPERRQ